jgi:hypothetical protein
VAGKSSFVATSITLVAVHPGVVRPLARAPKSSEIRGATGAGTVGTRGESF